MIHCAPAAWNVCALCVLMRTVGEVAVPALLSSKNFRLGGVSSDASQVIYRRETVGSIFFFKQPG
jgi:hypothetical protein